MITLPLRESKEVNFDNLSANGARDLNKQTIVILPNK